MEYERIEYIRKTNRKRTYVDKDSGEEKTQLISKGVKKGVLYCGIDPDDHESVIVGFSLCNNVDRFDYINGKSVPGFGLNTAKERAEKWKLHVTYFVQNSFTEGMIMNAIERNGILEYKINPEPSEVVEVPPSIHNRLKTFIVRCKKYYKDKEFPEWVEKINNNEPHPDNMMETYACEF